MPPNKGKGQRPYRPRPTRKNKPMKSPLRDFLASQIPVYPDFTDTECLRARLQAHPLYRHSTASTHRGMLNRLDTLIRQERVMRAGKGLFARPRTRADLKQPWRLAERTIQPVSLAEDLKAANARLRADLDAGRGIPDPVVDPFS